MSTELRCKTCGDTFETLEEYTQHIMEFEKTNKMNNKSDFETPLMRDISKLSIQILFGLLIAVTILFLFVWPFSVTIYGDHCTVQTSYSIARYVLEQLTISC